MSLFILISNVNRQMSEKILNQDAIRNSLVNTPNKNLDDVCRISS